MIVSRETSERLCIYSELLQKWSPRINLVSPTSLEDAEKRHFSDSLQIASLCPENAKTWVDMGSGGGFPGAVVAIALENTDLEVTLIESDQRKATFLRTVSRETDCKFTVIAERIENVRPQNADVVSARALSNLTDLFGFASRHMNTYGTALFHKGASWRSEVKEAENKWRFTCKAHKSKTNADAVILEIGDLARV